MAKIVINPEWATLYDFQTRIPKPVLDTTTQCTCLASSPCSVSALPPEWCFSTESSRFLVREMWALLAVGTGIALAWVAQFNLWEMWNLPHRKYEDEADVIESDHRHIRRAA